MSERKIKAWEQAGVIDAAAAMRIRAWEADHSRPIGLWAMVGLGGLAIGLGFISVVAANWDAIPGEVRLAIHFALMAGLGLFVWLRLSRIDGDNDHFHDALLFVAAILGLTFFGHLGQVYQTSAPLWQPLLAWIILFSPLLLLFGRGWPIAGLWMAGVLGTAWAHASEYGVAWVFVPSGAPRPSWPTFYWGLIACPPMVVAAFAALMRSRTDRPEYWRLLEQLAIATIFAGLSIAIAVRGWDDHADYAIGSVAIQSLFLAGAGAAIYAARPTPSGQATAAILAVAAVVHLLESLLLQPTQGTLHQWIGALCFLALWAAVAYAALHARWRRIFQLAIGLLAARIIILSFELNDDLLGSGVGLITSGLLAMGIAWGTVRISRRYAPRTGEAA